MVHFPKLTTKNYKLKLSEKVFIGNPTNKGDANNKNKMSDEYMASVLMLENTELKKKIKDLDDKNIELAQLVKQQMNGEGLQ